MERQNFPRESPYKGTTFRFFNIGLGWHRSNFKTDHSGILENRTRSPHQHIGTFCSSSDNKKFCQTGGKSYHNSGQHSGLSLPKKGWGQKASVQPIYARSLALVHDTQYSSRNTMGSFSRKPGGLFKPFAFRSRGLHFKCPSLQPNDSDFPTLDTTKMGHFCLTREQKNFRTSFAVGHIGRLPWWMPYTAPWAQ